jgi:anti-sigma regulatory factor (Ser/Thr protein kinase)
MDVERRQAFPLNEHAPARARRWLAEALGGYPDLENAILLASELVANSVQHSGCEDPDHVEISLRRLPRAIRVEVSDPGPGFEAPVRSAPSHGLHFVREISD